MVAQTSIDDIGMNSPEIEFRLARENDLPSIAENEQLAHIHPWSLRLLQESLTGQHLFWVAEARQRGDVFTDKMPVEREASANQANKNLTMKIAASLPGPLLGHMVVMPLIDQWELLNLVVCPSQQNSGIGGRWMRFLLEQARLAGVKQVFLEVRESNHSAISLYNKFEFKPIGLRKNYYPVFDGREISGREITGREDALVLAVELD